MVVSPEIDIQESVLRRRGRLLELLLLDRSTGKNIIWATDSYAHLGTGFAPERQITESLITGPYKLLIQPRVAKSLEEQRRRTREKAEVFTPLRIIDKINKAVETTPVTADNWQDYVRELRLEITCGEAPFIVSRYNPTARGALIKLEHRVGFLDRKLRVVSKYCPDEASWLEWARVAFQSSYGYEWQGDNVLIARENLLYTLGDYYTAQFGKSVPLAVEEKFAEIIGWNIFQMDGLKYVLPMSCHHEERVVPGEVTLFDETPDRVEKYECEGCKYNRIKKHNGRYARIMDWTRGKSKRFVNLQ